jgi:hypothetical protein
MAKTVARTGAEYREFDENSTGYAAKENVSNRTSYS